MLELYVIFAWKKLSKCPNFYYICPKKITKFPNFTWYLSENVEILRDNCPKNKLYFREFYWEGTWGAHRILRLWLHGQLAHHASSLFIVQRSSTYSLGNRKKLGVAPLEFRHEPDICKQTRFWLSVSEEIFVPFNTISERDGQTDGHLCYSNTSTCISCYDTATALPKKSCFHTWKSFRPPYFTFPNLLEILITPLILLDAAFSTPAFSAPQRDHWRTKSAAVQLHDEIHACI